MRDWGTKEMQELDKLVKPYIVSVLPRIIYREGTPDEIKEAHQRLIKLSFEQACNA